MTRSPLDMADLNQDGSCARDAAMTGSAVVVEAVKAANAQEGHVQVPGAVLHFRLVGPADSKHTVVFENGWSGSFPYAHWLEVALASQVRVLFYNRAGIGESRRAAPVSPEGMTRQLEALLAHLGIATPVVLAGHSYGGLIAALHAAQSPSMVEAVVQIDPTPEFRDPLLDAQLNITAALGRLVQLLILLGLDGALFAQFRRDLPAEVHRRLKPGRIPELRSWNGAIAEFEVQQRIRQIVAESERAPAAPRLVISAAPKVVMPTGLRKLFAKPQKEAAFRRMAHELHQAGAALNERSQWLSLPFDHVGLITNRDAASRIAAATLDFLQQTFPDAGSAASMSVQQSPAFSPR